MSRPSSTKSVRLVVRRLGVEVDEGAARGVFEGALAEALCSPRPLAQAPRCKFGYLAPGRLSSRRGLVGGRFYVQCAEEDVDLLVEALRRATRTPEGATIAGFDRCLVERAPFEKALREPNRPDRREGTWETSEEYKAFLALPSPTDLAPSKAPETNPEDRPNPLLDYVQNKARLFGSSKRRAADLPPKPAKKKDTSAPATKAAKKAPRAPQDKVAQQQQKKKKKQNKKGDKVAAAGPSNSKAPKTQKKKKGDKKGDASKPAAKPVILLRRPGT